MTQTQAILEHLQRGLTLTPLQALDRWGCGRLAARVNDLRKAGYDIQTDMVKRNGKTFASYWLAGTRDLFAPTEPPAHLSMRPPPMAAPERAGADL